MPQKPSISCLFHEENLTKRHWKEDKGASSQESMLKRHKDWDYHWLSSPSNLFSYFLIESKISSVWITSVSDVSYLFVDLSFLSLNKLLRLYVLDVWGNETSPGYAYCLMTLAVQTVFFQTINTISFSKYFYMKTLITLHIIYICDTNIRYFTLYPITNNT